MKTYDVRVEMTADGRWEWQVRYNGNTLNHGADTDFFAAWSNVQQRIAWHRIGQR